MIDVVNKPSIKINPALLQSTTKYNKYSTQLIGVSVFPC